MPYAKGKYAIAMCPVGGHQTPYRNLKRRWDGLWVSSEEWEPKHPQLTPKTRIYDPQALQHPWPDNNDGGPSTTVTQLYEIFDMTFSPNKQPT